MKEPYKQVAIVGPKHSFNVIAPINNAWQNSTLLSHTLLGDGVSGVDPQDMGLAFSNCDEDTHIHFWGHGSVVNGRHGISIEAKRMPTDVLLRKAKGVPGVFHVYSCYCGAAKDAVKMLGEDKPVIFHSGRKYTTLEAMNSEEIAAQGVFYQKAIKDYGRAPNAYDAFEYSMLTSPETIIIAELLGNNVQSFKGCATKKPVGNDGLKTYLVNQLNKFRQDRIKYLGHTEDMFLPMEEILTDTALDHYLKKALVLEINRKKSNHGSEYVEQYLQAGIDPNYTLYADHSPLLMACKNGNVEIVSLLLRYGADPNYASKEGITPLNIAFEAGHSAIVDMLLRHDNINIGIADNTGVTLLYAASEDGNHALVTKLLDMGADVNQGLYGTFTPFMVAAMSGHKEVVDAILQHPQASLEYLRKLSDTTTASEFCLTHDIEIQEGNDDLLDKSAAQIARDKGHIDIANAIELKIKELTIAKYSGDKNNDIKQGIAL